MDPTSRAERLLSVTDGWFPFAIDGTAVTTQELALAGVVRCRRLLKGMIREYDAPDLVGLFARTFYETYLTTLYLSLGGDEAYERPKATDDFELRHMAKRFLKTTDPEDSVGATLREQSESMLAAPAPTGTRIITAELARELRRLLAAIGDPNAEFPVDMYSALFGPESYTSAHGGIGAIKQYLLGDGQVSSRISAEPWRHPGNAHRIDLMTAALLPLAMRVRAAVGLPVAELEDLAQEWSEEGWEVNSRSGFSAG